MKAGSDGGRCLQHELLRVEESSPILLEKGVKGRDRPLKGLEFPVIERLDSCRISLGAVGRVEGLMQEDGRSEEKLWQRRDFALEELGWWVGVACRESDAIDLAPIMFAHVGQSGRDCPGNRLVPSIFRKCRAVKPHRAATTNVPSAATPHLTALASFANRDCRHFDITILERASIACTRTSHSFPLSDTCFIAFGVS